MDDYLKLEEYPAAIKEIAEALIEAKVNYKRVEAELKYAKAQIERFSKLEGSNKEQRDAHLVMLLHEDLNYKGLNLRLMELDMTRSKLEVEMNLLRDQFAVLKLQAQERISHVRELEALS